MTLREAHEDLRQDVGADCGSNCERELTDDTVFELADERATAADRLDRAVGMRQEGPASGRQDHARVRSPKQARAELLFKSLEPGTEGRLADREGLRCASHVPLPGDLDETFDLGEEHGNGLETTIDRIDHTTVKVSIGRMVGRIVRSLPSRCYGAARHGTQRRSTSAGRSAGRVARAFAGQGAPRVVDGADSLVESARPYSFGPSASVPVTASGTTRTSDAGRRPVASFTSTMSTFEMKEAAAREWFDSPGSRGSCVSTPPARSSSSGARSRPTTRSRATAAEAFYARLRELFAERKQITTFGPYSPGQAVAMKRMGIEGIYLGGWATSAKGSADRGPGPRPGELPAEPGARRGRRPGARAAHRRPEPAVRPRRA